MTAQQIAKLIDSFAPEILSKRLISEFGEYDNTGLLVRGSGREISRVLVCLDVTSEAVREAKNLGCQMILSHHPAIYLPVKELDFEGENRALVELIQSDISVYSSHLSLDSAANGINRTLADRLGLLSPVPLLDLGEGCGLLFCGEFAGDFQSLLSKLKSVTGGTLRFSENAGKKEKLRVAVVNGGGADVKYLAQAKKAGCDTFVSGEVKHHVFVWAKNNGMNLADAGHFETEHFYLQILTDALNRTGAGVTFLLSGQTAPYQTL